MGDDTSHRFIVAQRKDGIGRTARLECADLLEVLALEMKSRTHRSVERITGHHRRAADVRRDARSRGSNGEEIDGDIGLGSHCTVDGHALRQLPRRLCALEKNRSFHDSGRTLIVPTLCMKSTYFMIFCGAVV